MALKTGRMRSRTGGNRLADAARRRFMTGRAIRASVSGVVEPHAEAPQGRKGFYASRFRVRMTDCADRVVVIFKLQRMTADTGRMIILAGKPDACGIGTAAVTDQTR